MSERRIDVPVRGNLLRALNELEAHGYPRPYVIAHDDGCPAMEPDEDEKSVLAACNCEIVTVVWAARP